MALVPRFVPFPRGSFFLLGPRGTGKTTWLKECLPDAHFVNLLRPDLYRELGCEKRVHFPDDRSPRQQVHAPTPELSGAGPGEDEAVPTSVVDEVVDRLLPRAPSHEWPQ